MRKVIGYITNIKIRAKGLRAEKLYINKLRKRSQNVIIIFF